MREAIILKIREVEKLVKEGKSMAEPHLSFVSNSKGCGGIIDATLMLPESVTIFIAPLACARHVTVYPWQRTGRVFFLEEEEMDIVTGAHLDVIDEVICEIMETVNPRPKMIMLCASCIDKLMVSDFAGIARSLSKKYNVRIEMTWMDPVIGKVHPQQRLWDKIFSMIEPSEKNEKANVVNLIGRLRSISEDSEMHLILKEAGIEKIVHISKCRNLKEFEEMSEASLNIIGNKMAETAGKIMRKKHGIPCLTAYPTFDPDNIHAMYQQMGKLLNRELHDEEYYDAIKERLRLLAIKMKGKTVAVGESHAGMDNSFQMAVDLCKIGIDVKYILCDGFISSKQKEIEWLSQNAEDIEVVLMSHPSMISIVENPLPVDFAIGTHEDWYSNRKETKWITMERKQQDSDYASIGRLIDIIEESI